MSGTSDDCLNMELLDSVITKYFTKKFENCQEMIVRKSLMFFTIYILKLIIIGNFCKTFSIIVSD